MEQEQSTEERKTDAEVTQEAYKADLERFRDFSDNRIWPEPIHPRWKN